MKYKLEDLIEIALLQSLMEKLNAIYSFPSAIIDNDGKILIAVAWQDVCTKFHRTNPECEKECIKSDKYILDHLHEANPAISYKCIHGLIDNAAPIIIDGKHLGNFFTGQFFLEKPDLEFFKMQAKKYGFNEKAYMEAVKRVPVWSKEKLDKYLDFIKGFIELIANIGLNQLKEIEAKRIIKETEEQNKAIIKSTSDWIWEIDVNGKYVYCSERVEQVLGYSPKEIIGRTPFELMTQSESDRISPIFQDIVKGRQIIKDLESWNLHKNGQLVCLNTHGFPIFNKNDNFQGYVGANKDITDKKIAEDKIIKSEEIFKSVVENSSDLTIISDENDLIIFISPQCKSMFGYASRDYLGKKIPFIIHPDDIEGCRKKWAQLKNRDEDVINYEYRVFDIHKNELWVSHSAKKVRVGESLLGFLSAIRDITDKKIAEDKLIKSEIRFREVVEMLPEAVLETDLNLRITYVNKRGLEMSGYTEAEVKEGLNGLDLLSKESQIMAKEYFQKRLSGINPGKVEYVAIKKDGTPYPILFHASSIITNGEITGLRGIIVDITDRKEAVDALHESEERYRNVVNVSPDPIIIHSEGIIVFANQATLNMYGATNAEMIIGKSAIGFIHPDDRELALSRIKEMYITGKPAPTALERMIRVDGSVIYVELSATLTPYKGKLASMVVCHDITERINNEQELKKYRESLEEMVKSRTFELEEKNIELKKFNDLFVGREFRIKELRDKVKDLEKRLSKD